jgi:hypothetical protein
VLSLVLLGLLEAFLLLVAVELLALGLQVVGPSLINALLPQQTKRAEGAAK